MPDTYPCNTARQPPPYTIHHTMMTPDQYRTALSNMGTCWVRNMPSAYTQVVAELPARGAHTWAAPTTTPVSQL